MDQPTEKMADGFDGKTQSRGEVKRYKNEFALCTPSLSLSFSFFSLPCHVFKSWSCDLTIMLTT